MVRYMTLGFDGCTNVTVHSHDTVSNLKAKSFEITCITCLSMWSSVELPDTGASAAAVVWTLFDDGSH